MEVWECEAPQRDNIILSQSGDYTIVNLLCQEVDDVPKGSSEIVILEGRYPRVNNLQSVNIWTLVSKREGDFPCCGIHDYVCRKVLYFPRLNKQNP